MSPKCKQTFAGLLSFAGLVSVVACGPAFKSNMQPTMNTTAVNSSPGLEEDLVPTLIEVNGTVVKNGKTYEAPPKIVKNPQAEIILGQLKFTQTTIVYEPGTHRVRVKGTAIVLDQDQHQISQSDFELSGVNDGGITGVKLKSTLNEKSNSSMKPVVRASVTCPPAKDELDCSKAIVDFFVAYKKKLYSQQMVLAQKQATAEPVAQPTDGPAPIPAPSDSSSAPTSTDDSSKLSDDLQTEGDDESADGRYQGQAETIDLKAEFADDESDDSPFTPAQGTPPAPAPPPSQTKPTPSVPPSQPEPKVTPQPEPKVTPQPEPKVTPQVDPVPPAPKVDPLPAKDRPLTKDLMQTKTGDVRQVNQAIGKPDAGQLRNATSLLAKQQGLNQQACFEVVSPDRNRYYATYEMAELISRVGQYSYQSFNHKLYVRDISQKNGDKIYSVENGVILKDKYGNPILAHASHRIGVDADLGYATEQSGIKFPVVVEGPRENRQYNSSSYSVAKTYQLLKYAYKQQDIRVDRIFADEKIKAALCTYAKSQNELTGSDKELVAQMFKNIQHVDGHGDHFHLRLKCSTYDPACINKLYLPNAGCQ